MAIITYLLRMLQSSYIYFFFIFRKRLYRKPPPSSKKVLEKGISYLLTLIYQIQILNLAVV